MSSTPQRDHRIASRIARAAPLAIGAALLPIVSGVWGGAAIVAPVILLSIFIAPRPLSRTTANLFALIALLFGFMIGAALSAGPPIPNRIGSVWAGVAVAALLAGAARLMMRDAPLRYGGTCGLAFVAMVACGQTQSGSVYASFAFAFVLSVLVSLRGDDDARPAWRRLSLRTIALSLVLLAFAAAMTAALLAGLPEVHDWVQTRFELAYGSGDDARAGFSDQMRLGAMRSMIQSDEVVLRVYGPNPEYLRGAVFDTYTHGVGWFALRPAHELRLVPTKRGPLVLDSDIVEIHRVGGAATDRFFLPFAAHDVATLSAAARVDDMGIARKVAGDLSNIVWFRYRASPAPAQPEEAFDVAPPTNRDLMISELRTDLEPLAKQWTEGASTAEAKLDALTQHLATGYRYSLTYERTSSEPLLDFLFVHREGHCEYFASAFAALARTVGIPARVVVGYRVAEKNPLGGDYIVRERNAHAWVEAYLEGKGWTTYDPTPASFVPQNGPHEAAWTSAVLDAIAASWDAALVWIGERNVFELVGAAGAAIMLLLSVRWLRLRRDRARGEARDASAFSEALPSFSALLAALETRGAARSHDETLERFATRLEGEALPAFSKDPSLAREAASLVRRYAAHRYGGIGAPETIKKDLTTWSGRLKSG